MCGGVAAYADQVYLLTGLGNLFPVDGERYALPNGTLSLSPRMVPHQMEGIFLAGESDDAGVVSFHTTYNLPGGVAASTASVYAAAGGPYVSTITPNHGTYLYRSGYLELSTSGLDHILGSMHGRVFEGVSAYRGGTDYTTLYGNGTAAYSLKHTRHGGEAVDDFLVHTICYAPPCGSVTAAKSHDTLLTFPGTLGQARLSDVVRLGADPVIISEDHYLIVDTAPGDVRLRAAAYDYDRFEIRGMPRGTAYVMDELPSIQWWPAAYASHGCCYAPHEHISAYRAGVQTSSQVISYGSDSLAATPGDRHDIGVSIYPDVLWWQGRAAGWHLLFDYVNGQVARSLGSPDMVILPNAYIRVASSAGATISDISLAGVACDSSPRLGMPYLQGDLVPGDAVYVPAIPGYSVLCVEMDGVRHTIPYHDISGDARSIPLTFGMQNRTIRGMPDAVPCVHCGYDMWQLRHDMEAYAHASTVSVRDGVMRLAVTGHAAYVSDVSRHWDTTYPTADIAHWAPSMPARQDGSPILSIYRNGMLYESSTVPCEPDHTQSHTRSAYYIGGVYTYGWEHAYRYACETGIISYVDVEVAAGDIVEAVVWVSPDMTYQTAARDTGSVEDAGYQSVRVGGTLVISYR